MSDGSLIRVAGKHRVSIFCDFKVSDLRYCLILVTCQLWEGALVD